MSDSVEMLEPDYSEYLVKRILGGDKAAETDMVNRYQRGVSAVIFNKARDRVLAEDVIQETWILVVNKIRDNQLRDRKKLAAFIISIAKNQLLMSFRKNKKHQTELDINDVEISSNELSPQQIFENGQLGSAITCTFNSLSQKRDRELLRRFYLVGDSKLQICEEFNLKPGQFDGAVHRARERFKVLWLNMQN